MTNEKVMVSVSTLVPSVREIARETRGDGEMRGRWANDTKLLTWVWAEHGDEVVYT